MKNIIFVLTLTAGSLAFGYNPCLENPNSPLCLQQCQMNPNMPGCPHQDDVCIADPYGAECAELCMVQPEHPSCPID